MNIDEVLSSAGKYKSRKRLGRGIGSRQGKTAGRGHKGLGARSGAGKRLSYAGGQNPILARIPKRGFNNANFRKAYRPINVSALDKFENGARVDAAALAEAKLIDNPSESFKILGGGELTKKLTVVAGNLSTSALAKIKQAGGAVEPA